MKNLIVKKVCLAGILATLALTAHVIENLFPPLIMPGARLGLSNVFILLGGILLGDFYAYAILLVKILLGNTFSGHFEQIIYAIPAGLISLTVQLLALRLLNKISIVSISAVGGTLHLAIQNVIFCLLNDAIEYLTYLPYLTMIGLISGIAVGFAVWLIIKFLPEKTISGIL